ncbi:hypothetical protein ALC57_05087 [Trachymyrmex cornetzi]|uniref:SAM domain-containing protein n=1 Tax=Trachymyrmex cornetzi TaxID=471704 RepID=A0A151JBM9_9HYME|nr:hypothetical protein ALC57_05087 [Trachymyrmex cornetzi]
MHEQLFRQLFPEIKPMHHLSHYSRCIRAYNYGPLCIYERLNAYHVQLSKQYEFIKINKLIHEKPISEWKCYGENLSYFVLRHTFITGETLCSITENDLRDELKIKMGARKRILRIIDEITQHIIS